MRTLVVIAAAALLTASGCATVSTPWYEQVKAYPRIGLGDPKPADGNYVLHLPAGKPVPTRIIIGGGIFEKETEQDVMATPRRDIYFYNDLVSFDMERWERVRATLDFDFDFEFPSHKNPRPGHIKIIVNEKAAQ